MNPNPDTNPKPATNPKPKPATKPKPNPNLNPKPKPAIKTKGNGSEMVVPVATYINADTQKEDILNGNRDKTGIYR